MTCMIYIPSIHPLFFSAHSFAAGLFGTNGDPYKVAGDVMVSVCSHKLFISACGPCHKGAKRRHTSTLPQDVSCNVDAYKEQGEPD